MIRKNSQLIVLAGICLFPAWGARAGNLDWSALNPAFKDASFVNDPGICLNCHEDASKHFDQTKHSRLTGQQNVSCESCHGPRSTHIDEPDKKLILTDEQREKACIQCHQGGDRIMWQSGTHNAAGVTCVSCHNFKGSKNTKGTAIKTNQPELCYSCHMNIRAETQKVYHHPIREGKINCSDCHQVHGSTNQKMLKTATVNETCYLCHQEKRGPFLFEHAPVREDCMNCHQAHGSNNSGLLKTKGASQCVTCHQYGGHPNEFRYNRVSTPYANGCGNCHKTIHGSNHPSGAKFTR